jgi:shikimate dehydrogenase
MTENSPNYAVIGHPISHSRSPMIHQAFAEQTGVSLTYSRIDAQPDHFEAEVTAFFANGGKGLNVTVPFKERAWSLAQANLSDRARLAGAVNTLWQVKGHLWGCNTDGVGLVNDLSRLGVLLQDQSVLILGAGGAARGVLGPLLAAGCAHLCIMNRTPARAQALIEAWIHHSPADAARLSASGLTEPSSRPWQVVINATASSLSGESLALPHQVFLSTRCAYDMMYGAQPTAFMRQAQAQEVEHVHDGLGMLVAQAAESFRLWHGQTPNMAPVIEAIRKQIQQPSTSVR